MSRYYVISPNVENDGNIQDYLEQMFQTHTIMMGWSPQEHKGKMFDEMQIGDYVICARGANKNKQIFFAGMVSSENTTYDKWIMLHHDQLEELIEKYTA